MSRTKTMNLVNDERRGLLASSLILALLTAVLFALLSASGFAATAESAGKKALSPADIERARNYFTDTLLTTHEGKQVRFYSDLLNKRTVVINVMYTSCKGACPMMTQTLSFVSEQVGAALPQGYRRPSVPRAARSHCASVGSCLPAHLQYVVA